MAWTDEDQVNYDRLIAEGKKKEANNLKKAVDNAIKQYSKAQKKDDYFTMNNAVYSVVEARQKVYNYEDSYDYTYGNDTMTFLGVHKVAFGQYHTSTIIFTSSDSEFYNDDNLFKNSAYGGKVKYATLGAGSSKFMSGNLVSDVNREKDVMLGLKVEMINLNISDSTTITRLISLEKYYRENQKNQKNQKYTLLPIKSTSHNSNSFTHGLLNAAGIDIPKEPSKNVPGWNTPLDESMFGS